MNALDEAVREVLECREVFSDIYNYLLYDGEPVIQPKDLVELDTREGKTLKFEDIQKTRDAAKCWKTRYKGKRIKVILGLEHQSLANPDMPRRIEGMNSLSYEKQHRDIATKHKIKKDLKTSEEYLAGFSFRDKYQAVVTAVVYTGKKKWRGAKRFSDLIQDWPGKINDSNRMLLFDMYRIKRKELYKFRSFLRVILNCIMYSQNKKSLVKYCRTEEMRNCDNRAARLIATMLNIEIEVPKEKGVTDMCKAIEDLIEERSAIREEKGREEGIAIGEEKGRKLEFEETIKRMIRLKLEDELICKALNLTLSALEQFKLKEELLQSH